MSLMARKTNSWLAWTKQMYSLTLNLKGLIVISKNFINESIFKVKLTLDICVTCQLNWSLGLLTQPVLYVTCLRHFCKRWVGALELTQDRLFTSSHLAPSSILHNVMWRWRVTNRVITLFPHFRYIQKSLQISIFI